MTERFLLGVAALAIAAVAWSSAGQEGPDTSPDTSTGATEQKISPGRFVFDHPHLDFTGADLALDGAGGALLVWLASTESWDRVFACALAEGEWGEVFELTGSAGVRFAPRVVATGAGRYLAVWCGLDGEGYDLFAREVEGGAAGPLERVTTSPGVDRAPGLAATPDGEAWLAWEGVRGGVTDVFVRSRAGGVWGAARNVSRHPSTDAQPTIAFDPASGPWVAWTSWRDGTFADGNYEIYALALGAEDAESARVSTSGRVDMYPSLQSLASGLALVWTECRLPLRDSGPTVTRGYDRWTDKCYQVSWLEDGAFGEPRTALSFDESQDLFGSDVAVPAAAEGGGLLLAYGRTVRETAMNETWSPRLCRVGPQGTQLLNNRAGSSLVTGDPPAIAARDGEVWQVDVVVAEVAARAAVGHTKLRVRVRKASSLEPAEASVRPPAAAESADVVPPPGREPAEGRAVDPSGTWNAYFGNLHLHSRLSRDGCGFEGEPAENYRVVRDVVGLDFAGLSDHVESLTRSEWRSLRKLADLFDEPGRFITFPGYEWTSFKYGHRNVFFQDTQVASESATFAAQQGRTPDDLWAFLEGTRAIAIPHHPSHSISQPVDWSFRNDAHQRLVEIYQVRGNYEYDGAPLQRTDSGAEFVEGHSVRDALGMGHRLGIIASPDHGGGPGLAGVWAEELTRESVFEALHARRTFGTTGAMMSLFMTVDGAPQGSEIVSEGGPVRLEARVRGTAEVLELAVISGGKEVHRTEPRARTATLEWTDPESPKGVRYYYVRATQADGHIAWTSPVWVSP